MARFVAAAALLAMTAAACDEAPPSEPAPPIKITNPYHDRLAALAPDTQRLGVMRAIRDNGKRCQRVEGAAHQQAHEGLEMWVALCADGRHWGLFIGPNGDTQVRDCQQMRQLGLPQCRPVTATRSESDPF